MKNRRGREGEDEGIKRFGAEEGKVWGG